MKEMSATSQTFTRRFDAMSSFNLYRHAAPFVDERHLLSTVLVYLTHRAARGMTTQTRRSLHLGDGCPYVSQHTSHATCEPPCHPSATSRRRTRLKWTAALASFRSAVPPR